MGTYQDLHPIALCMCAVWIVTTFEVTDSESTCTIGCKSPRPLNRMLIPFEQLYWTTHQKRFLVNQFRRCFEPVHCFWTGSCTIGMAVMVLEVVHVVMQALNRFKSSAPLGSSLWTGPTVEPVQEVFWTGPLRLNRFKSSASRWHCTLRANTNHVRPLRTWNRNDSPSTYLVANPR